MRQYEEARDPIPPGHGERQRDPETIERDRTPCRCGHPLDRHDLEDGDCLVPACPCRRYIEDVREPDGVRYLGAGRYGVTS